MTLTGKIICMRDFDKERGPTINFEQLDRQTVFSMPSKSGYYFIRTDIRHCQNAGRQNCNHVCLVMPKYGNAGWDIRGLVDEEMKDSDTVVPVGRA